ncbi:hypothetical protein AcV7_005100 [Taiwanofungus camphoratus]|nr:hypothetical protein AcV7_005100 [Antrodia cinnamomea]
MRDTHRSSKTESARDPNHNFKTGSRAGSYRTGQKEAGPQAINPPIRDEPKRTRNAELQKAIRLEPSPVLPLSPIEIPVPITVARRARSVCPSTASRRIAWRSGVGAGERVSGEELHEDSGRHPLVPLCFHTC